MAIPLAPIIGAIPSIAQAIGGLFQGLAGKRQLENLERPQYTMPGEVNSMVTLAAQNYADPRTAAQLNAERGIGLSGANAVMAGRDSGNLAGIIPAIVSAQSQGYNRLSEQQDTIKEQQRQALMNTLQLRAQYKDTEFQINKFAPYAQAYNEGREMVGAGAQNLYGGLNNLATLGMQAATLAQAQSRQSFTPSVAAGITSPNVNQNGALGSLITGYSGSQDITGAIVNSLSSNFNFNNNGGY